MQIKIGMGDMRPIRVVILNMLLPFLLITIQEVSSVEQALVASISGRCSKRDNTRGLTENEASLELQHV